MDLLIVFVLAAVAGAALVAGVIVWSTDRASHSAITRYFKASEFIIEHHRPPPDWVLRTPGRWLRARSIRSISKADILERLDELIVFFEKCSFFEDEFAREQLLLKLRKERENWQSKLQI